MPAPVKFRQLDVRPWLAKGQEPLSPILERVEQLKPDEGLKLVAPFLPAPLIERLKGEGYASRFDRGKAGEWVVFFWKNDR